MAGDEPVEVPAEPEPTPEIVFSDLFGVSELMTLDAVYRYFECPRWRGRMQP